MADEPATKEDIEQLRSEMGHIHHDLVERITDGETRLLKAFYNFAEGNTKHLSQIDGNVAIFLNRLGSLETRVLDLEKRLNIPPAA